MAGYPVSDSIVVTEIPDCRRVSAVPPVATISIPNSARVAANVCRPAFSHTLTSARRTGTTPAASGILFIMACSISHLLGLSEACRFEILCISQGRGPRGHLCPRACGVNYMDTPVEHPQSSLGKQADGCGVEPALFKPHVCGQRLHRVIILHHNGGLQDDRPAVRRFIGEVHRAP